MREMKKLNSSCFRPQVRRVVFQVGPVRVGTQRREVEAGEGMGGMGGGRGKEELERGRGKGGRGRPPPVTVTGEG